MDKHLRPARFDTEPNSTNAEKEWRHWYRTFLNFINAIHPPQQQQQQQQQQQNANADAPAEKNAPVAQPQVVQKKKID